MRRLVRIDDEEDIAHNVIVRLLKAAQAHGQDLSSFLEGNPKSLWQCLEAERGQLRRRGAREAEQMTEELAESLGADQVPSEFESAELLKQVACRVRLSSRERQVLLLRYVCGLSDYGVISVVMGVKKDELYRLHSEAVAKLKAASETTKQLLDNHEHRKRTFSQLEGGAQKQDGHRIL